MGIFNFFRGEPPVVEDDEVTTEPITRASALTGDGVLSGPRKWTLGERLAAFASVAPPVPAATEGLGMDSADCDGSSLKNAYTRGQPGVSDELAMWYASQSFIGHQLCALIAQHWLIQKACVMPARDAIRNGFEIVARGDDTLSKEQHAAYEFADKKYGLRKHLLDFLGKGRIFGVRICLFDIEYDDPIAAYAAPFNPDGVMPRSYKGIVQVDPYWCAPELDGKASSQPNTMHFYEPTHWLINGKRYHRSHLIIFRNGMLADILKPAYIYGGIPVPQLIMERVYGAERTANEAPLLALTKRTVVYSTNMAKALANWPMFVERVAQLTQFWTNHGVRVIDKEEDAHEQYDTALADLDALIMTQFQLVAAGAEVPATKLLGTSVKGFNATGEFDEASYHETLESYQEHDLTPLVDRHHLLLSRSLGLPPVDHTWQQLDSATGRELADINLVKAQTGQALVMAGAIDGSMELQRVQQDKFSGYSGMSDVGTPD